MHDGLRLYIDLSDIDIGVNILLGLYEDVETRIIHKHVKSSQKVIDIVANIGYFTIILLYLIAQNQFIV